MTKLRKTDVKEISLENHIKIYKNTLKVAFLTIGAAVFTAHSTFWTIIIIASLFLIELSVRIDTSLSDLLQGNSSIFHDFMFEFYRRKILRVNELAFVFQLKAFDENM